MDITPVKDLIREKRHQLGLSREDVGDKVGVSQETVAKWEQGAVNSMLCYAPAL